jgi:hypothetical protein
VDDGNDESGEIFDGLGQLHDVEGGVGGGEEAGRSDGGRGAGGNKRNKSEGNDLRNTGEFNIRDIWRGKLSKASPEHAFEACCNKQFVM